MEYQYSFYFSFQNWNKSLALPLFNGVKRKGGRNHNRGPVLIPERTPAALVLSCNEKKGKNMDVSKILADLRAEKEQLEEAILSLERLARGRGKRRGRPPAWMTEAKKRGRPPGSKNRPVSMSKSAAAA